MKRNKGFSAQTGSVYSWRIAWLGLLAATWAVTAGEAQVNNTVSVIDTSTNLLVGEPITVQSLALGIAITPDGSRAYVANNGSSSVSAIDLAAGTVVATIGVQSGPEWIAITPDGTRAYVTNEYASPPVVSVIDVDPQSPTYHTVIATVPVGLGPEKVALKPDGTRAYVANEFSNNVSVIDTNPQSPMYHSVIAIVPGFSSPEAIDVTPDGTRAYVTNEGGGSVLVIDTATNLIVAGPITVGCVPEGLAVNPSGTRAYVTNAIDNNVSVIDTDPSSPTYNTVIQTVSVGGDPQGVAFTPVTGEFAWVANWREDFVSKINTSTYAVTSVPARCNPYAVAMTPDGTRAYVTNSYAVAPCDLIAIIDCPISNPGLPARRMTAKQSDRPPSPDGRTGPGGHANSPAGRGPRVREPISRGARPLLNVLPAPMTLSPPSLTSPPHRHAPQSFSR